MSRIDALTAIGSQFHVDKVTTGKDGKTITLWLHRPLNVGQHVIVNLLKGTGYVLSGYGNNLQTKSHFIEITPLKGENK